MTCDCDEGNPPEFCDARMVTARQAHVCDDCKRTVAKGERYERISGKWDGSFAVVVLYSDCRLVRDLIGLYTEALRQRDRDFYATATGEQRYRKSLTGRECVCAPPLGTDLVEWAAEEARGGAVWAQRRVG